MTAPLGGGSESTTRAAAQPISVRSGVAARWWRTNTSRRLAFGYMLLAPAALYVLLLVGIPFLFSLYLAMSDASVGDQVSTFVPITVSVLSWKWMYDSQFSVINWGLHKVGLIGGYGSESWPIWLGQPHLALLACIGVNVWRSFPFSAIVLLAGFTSVPTEVLDAARVDGCSFFQRFRHIVTPMIFPILIIGFLFDTVFTLSDLSVVYVLTQGGPGSATMILPMLAYQIGIQAGSLGRGSAIALMLVPLLFPALFLMLRNLKRRDW